MSQFRDELYKRICDTHGPIPRHIFEEIVSECARKRLERSIEELITGAPIRKLFSDIEGAFPGSVLESTDGTIPDSAPAAAVDRGGTNSVRRKGGWHKSKIPSKKSP